MTSIQSLPLDLVADILSRLHVKALLRIKCVCKDWCNLIDSTNFVNMHLTRSTQNEMNRCLILDRDDRFIESSSKRCLYSIDLKSLSETIELDIPWWPRCHRNKDSNNRLLCCSCNGLLCLSSSWEDVILWNPSTNKHYFLPPLSLDDDDGLKLRVYTTFCDAVLGFGFDFATGDYKVVSILSHYAQEDKFIVNTEVKVFSLMSRSWQRVYEIPKGLRHQYYQGVLAGETLYWHVFIDVFHGEDRSYEDCSCYDSILAFDLQSEELHLVPMPINTKDLNAQNTFVRIHVMQGCLSLSNVFGDMGFDLWVMEKYGVEGSWTKLISINDPYLLSFHLVWPISYTTKNDGVLLIGGGDPIKVVWYDSESKTIEEAPIRDLPKHFNRMVLFSESLVPLSGGDH